MIEINGPLGFGGRLRRLRVARQMHRYELANALGCTGAAVGMWELGTGYPAFWNLVEITRYFGVDMDWLTGMAHVRNEMQDRTKVREQLKGVTV